MFSDRGGKGDIVEYFRIERSLDNLRCPLFLLPDDYEVEQTGTLHSYTLTINGTNSYTDGETGNTVTGTYTRIKTGTDVYEITETGTKIGGSYSQSITGEEEYTLTDEGNLATGNYTRTIEGSGEYDRTTTGAGATMPTDADTYEYSWEQTGDPHSGVFDLTPTGTSRYELLEDFFDISNTQSGQSPGHMNFYAFGQTFVDPFWEGVGAGLGGYWDGQVMVWNAGLNIVTLGRSPLNNHVDNLIQENGGGYRAANISANVGVGVGGFVAAAPVVGRAGSAALLEGTARLVAQYGTQMPGATNSMGPNNQRHQGQNPPPHQASWRPRWPPTTTLESMTR